ncbi:hypothetical protein RDI58_020226 [Solanum bulbocastanum]|uniref:Uncharacterized protein n=1 Tax=Solanum bulbocastanum TaxID=147425 RepID=A0AAN8T8C3_SOLBU
MRIYRIHRLKSDQTTMRSFSTSLFSCFFILILVLIPISFTHGNMMDVKVLLVGQELMKETLPLQSGSRLYELQGLNSNKWYEVKISYPASIPATFTLQLSKGSSGLNVGRKLLNTEKIIFQADNGLQFLGDKGEMFVLVNVEPEGIVAIPGVKEREHIIYNIELLELLSPEAIAAIGSQQTPFRRCVGLRKFNFSCFLAAVACVFVVSSIVTPSQCLANIMCISMAVCDELLFGIPHQAWYVVLLVVLCLALALVIPSFLPSYLLPRNQGLDAANHEELEMHYTLLSLCPSFPSSPAKCLIQNAHAKLPITPAHFSRSPHVSHHPRK